jgi:hypothetical protein
MHAYLLLVRIILKRALAKHFLVLGAETCVGQTHAEVGFRGGESFGTVGRSLGLGAGD